MIQSAATSGSGPGKRTSRKADTAPRADFHRPSPPLIAGFIDEQRAEGRGVESICTVLREQGVQVAPRTYRSWRTNPPAARAVSDAAVIHRLRGLKAGGVDGGPLPEVLYGRRKMTAWLERTGLPGVSKHTVDRLMRDEGMRGLVRGRKTRTTIGGKGGVRAGDLLNRQFRTSSPNRAWVTDFELMGEPGTSRCPGRRLAGSPEIGPVQVGAGWGAEPLAEVHSKMQPAAEA